MVDFVDDTGKNYTSIMNANFDKQTGVLVEFHSISYNRVNITQPVSNTSFTLISSSIWTVPEYPTFIVIPCALTTILIGVVLYKKNVLHKVTNHG
jgi:hypothetical protein